MEKIFKLQKNGTTVRTEILAGLTTFMTMAYIIALNPNLLSKIANLMQRGSIDKNQESLLKALRPYLSRQKLEKLERAMHAAKMAGIATEMVNPQGQSPFSRR